MSGWAFLAGIGVGFTLGMMLMSSAASHLMSDRIKAGGFSEKGILYRIARDEEGA